MDSTDSLAVMENTGQVLDKFRCCVMMTGQHAIFCSESLTMQHLVILYKQNAISWQTCWQTGWYEILKTLWIWDSPPPLISTNLQFLSTIIMLVFVIVSIWTMWLWSEKVGCRGNCGAWHCSSLARCSQPWQRGSLLTQDNQHGCWWQLDFKGRESNVKVGNLFHCVRIDKKWKCLWM